MSNPNPYIIRSLRDQIVDVLERSAEAEYIDTGEAVMLLEDTVKILTGLIGDGNKEGDA